MTTNDLTSKIIGCAFEIRRMYGKQMSELFYEKVMEKELVRNGLNVKRQVNIDIVHKGEIIPNAFRIDTLVEDSIVLEYKAMPYMTEEMFRQILTYLKITGLKLGYLINFGAKDFSFARPEDNGFILEKGLYRVIN